MLLLLLLLLLLYSTSPDFALKSEVLECFAMCQHCTIVEFSMLFWSFADRQVIYPPALHANWTGTDQHTYRQHCAATGANIDTGEPSTHMHRVE